MLIKIKNKDSLEFGDFIFKCSVGKNGIKKKKTEGDKSTPKGKFNIQKYTGKSYLFGFYMFL